MRQARILAVCCGLFLAVSGGILAFVARNAKTHVPGVDLNQPRHPVTPEMADAVRKMNRKVAPYFKLPDTDGKPTQIGGQGSKPQFIYSVKEGCPCSYDAEPLVQSMYRHFAGRVDFIAVTDAKKKEAKQWDLALKVPFPVVSVPKLEVMEAYEYPASVYCTLVDVNGLIVKRWPGYNKKALVDMVAEMSKLLGEEPKLFDTQYAPTENTSGCTFTGYEGKFGFPQDTKSP
jgi:peroxiredoxin